MGRETQLLAAEGSPPVSLFVLCGDRFEAARLFRSGGLSVRMARVEGHPVSMASCAVGDHHWMLSRDALVARLDARVFVFEMPGFFYAVVVPSTPASAAVAPRGSAPPSPRSSPGSAPTTISPPRSKVFQLTCKLERV